MPYKLFSFLSGDIPDSHRYGWDLCWYEELLVYKGYLKKSYQLRLKLIKFVT